MTNQTSRYLIDRSPEKTLLDELLQPEARQRILLLQASTGYGKSLLLETYDEVLEKRGHERALIPLDGGGMDGLGVLAALCHQWGWHRFSKFQQEVERLAMPTATKVSGITQIGYNRSQINLPENFAQRKAQIHILTSAWFEDARVCLSAARPAVILIDAYNLVGTDRGPATVSSELDDWVKDVFLTYVQQTRALRLILAGQQTPAQRLTPWERCCRRHSLGPIHSLEDWRQYADYVGIQVTPEIISVLCHTENGHPYAIAMRLTALRTWSYSL